MLAKGVQSQAAWTNQGYVCLTCRHQRALHVNRHRNRRITTEAASHRAIEDDAFTLNDISDSFGDKSSGQRAFRRPRLIQSQTVRENSDTNLSLYRSVLTRKEEPVSQETKPIRTESRKARILRSSGATRPKTSPKSARSSRADVAPSTGPVSEQKLSPQTENDIKSLLQQLQRDLVQDTTPTAGQTLTSSRDDIKTLLDGLRPGLQEALKQKADTVDEEAERHEQIAVALDNDLKRGPSAVLGEAERRDGHEAELDGEPIAKPAEQRATLSKTSSELEKDKAVGKPASFLGWREGLNFIKDTIWSKPETTTKNSTVLTASEETANPADPVKSFIVTASKARPPLNKPYTSVVQSSGGAAPSRIVDRIDALKARPKFGGNTTAPVATREVFYFDSFGKKDKHQIARPAIAGQPYGLSESLARANASTSAPGSAKGERPNVESLVADLDDVPSLPVGQLPDDSVTSKKDDGRPLARLSGLYENRSNSTTDVHDAVEGGLGERAFSEDSSSPLQAKFGALQKPMGASIEQAMENSRSKQQKTGLRIKFSHARAPDGAKLESESTSSSAKSKFAGSKHDSSEKSAKSKSARTKDDSGEKLAKSKSAGSKDDSGEKSGSDNPPPADDPPPDIKTSAPRSLEIKPLEMPQPPVPLLEYGLDRVLFNPGVYQLQDSASRVYNFDPYLQNIMPIIEFDFDSLKEYKTSSKDNTLVEMARKNQSKYIGSTSSMTSSLAHFHQLLSNWRPLNLSMLSSGFLTPTTSTQLTQINRAPSAIFLRWKNGTYAIDADKEYDNANVLMLLGKSMELLLTQPKSDFERYRKTDPRKIPDEERMAPETYQYTTMRDFLMRSQLDAHDPRLPGSGNFDLKTRAVVTVRMQSHDHEEMTGYELLSNQGRWFSYEKEYYDMMRSTMVKYMLQARMGRMNGIFVAYHNVERIFGFQYVPMADMDNALHGQTDPTLGDQEFRASLDLMNEVLNKATAKFPETSLRMHFETVPAKNNMPTSLHIFAEPMTEDEIDAIQDSQKAKIAEYERTVMGKEEPSIDEAIEEASTDAQTASSSRPEEEAIAETTTGQDVEHNDEVQAKSAAEAQDESATSTEDNDATSYARSLTGNDTSNSPADVPFLDSISTSRPLFYATVIIQSQVNGLTPDSGRPTKLTPDDNWEIDYILKEYNTTAHHWALYDDMKSRRRWASSSREEADEPGTLTKEEEMMQKKSDSYMQMLRSLSEKGRRLRKEVDERDEGKEVVRVEEKVDRMRVEIGSVDDYMKWMCGKGR